MAPTTVGTYVSNTHPVGKPGTYTGGSARSVGSYVSGPNAVQCPGRYTQTEQPPTQRVLGSTSVRRVATAA